MAALSLAAAAEGNVYEILTPATRREKPTEWKRKKCKSCKFLKKDGKYSHSCIMKAYANPNRQACENWKHK